MAKRKFQIDQLIINSPYEEPSTYWSYDREVRMPHQSQYRSRRSARRVLRSSARQICDGSARRFPCRRGPQHTWADGLARAWGVGFPASAWPFG